MLVFSLNRTQEQIHSEEFQADLDDTFNNLRATEEQTKKAMMDAARLAEELRAEQEHSCHIDRMRKSLESQCKDMQLRLDEAEQAALKGGKKVIAKLEQRVRPSSNWQSIDPIGLTNLVSDQRIGVRVGLRTTAPSRQPEDF